MADTIRSAIPTAFCSAGFELGEILVVPLQLAGATIVRYRAEPIAADAAPVRPFLSVVIGHVLAGGPGSSPIGQLVAPIGTAAASTRASFELNGRKAPILAALNEFVGRLRIEFLAARG